ncbi:hypothetical protein D3C86_1791950 [compost metagenome]
MSFPAGALAWAQSKLVLNMGEGSAACARLLAAANTPAASRQLKMAVTVFMLALPRS